MILKNVALNYLVTLGSCLSELLLKPALPLGYKQSKRKMFWDWSLSEAHSYIICTHHSLWISLIQEALRGSNSLRCYFAETHQQGSNYTTRSYQLRR